MIIKNSLAKYIIICWYLIGCLYKIKKLMDYLKGFNMMIFLELGSNRCFQEGNIFIHLLKTCLLVTSKPPKHLKKLEYSL